MEIVRARARLAVRALPRGVHPRRGRGRGRARGGGRARARRADAGAAEPPRLRRTRSFASRGRRRTTPLQPATTPASPRGDSANDPLKCSICYARKRTHAFVPCFHLHACEPCATRIVAHMPLCPLCRRVVERTQRVWT